MMNQVAPIQEQSLPSLVDRAASMLANARSAAEVLEARDMASIAYDAAKRAGRLAKLKDAHDEMITTAYRVQADALEIEARAKRRLADEYDAAQERGDVRGANTGRSASAKEAPSVSDIGLSHKQVHDARLVRDAEKADPGVVSRTLNERVESGQEPTKAALREAVIEAAKQGIRGVGAPSRKNPFYKPPTKAGAAWTRLYGTCRELAEWADDETIRLIIDGLNESTYDQTANKTAVRQAAEVLNRIAGEIDAQ